MTSNVAMASNLVATASGNYEAYNDSILSEFVRPQPEQKVRPSL